jgi:hypothetical protein
MLFHRRQRNHHGSICTVTSYYEPNVLHSVLYKITGKVSKTNKGFVERHLAFGVACEVAFGFGVACGVAFGFWSRI